MKRYKLLQDLVTPVMTTKAGVIKTESEWRDQINGLLNRDCEIKKDWFEEVPEKEYTREDIIDFMDFMEWFKTRKV